MDHFLATLRKEQTPVTKTNNVFYLDKDISPGHFTPRLDSSLKRKSTKKSKSRAKTGRSIQKQSFHNSTTKPSNSPYKMLLEKFKGVKANRGYKTKHDYSSRRVSGNVSHSPNKIFKASSRSNSRNKKSKATSTLTRWLQKLLESHSEKTKQRNVIDYFIYAIYTILADTNKTRERISSCVPFLRIIREMYPGLITDMYRDPKDEAQKYFNIELYSKCLIAIKMPIHKRIAKEKLRLSYEINEMLEHVYDLFLHIANDLAPVNFQSVTKGCQKTIAKFSKKLKEMIKHKGDFYLPKSRSRSKDVSPLRPSQHQTSEFSGVFDNKLDDDAKAYSSNEIVINDNSGELKAMST